MSDAIRATINELQHHINDLEQEIADTKRTCNKLAHRAGMPLPYADTDLLPRNSTANMRRDQFYGKTLTTALREYLLMRQAANLGPATVNEMFDGLSQGGFDHGSANDDNAKRVMRITLTKNSGLFHRLPDDKHFGLVEWYPNIKHKKSKAEEESESADPKESTTVETKPTDQSSQKK